MDTFSGPEEVIVLNCIQCENPLLKSLPINNTLKFSGFTVNQYPQYLQQDHLTQQDRLWLPKELFKQYKQKQAWKKSLRKSLYNNSNLEVTIYFKTIEYDEDQKNDYYAKYGLDELDKISETTVALTTTS